MQQFKDFILHMKTDYKVAILHDRDADGICSGSIVMYALEQLKLPQPMRLNQKLNEKTIIAETIETIKRRGITKLITTDLAVDQDAEAVKKAEQHCKILVLDHHKPIADISSSQTTLIRAQAITELYCPTSMLAFKLFSELVDLFPRDWVAAVGIVADGGYEQWKDFIDPVMERWKAALADMKKIAEIVNCVSLHENEQLVDQIFMAIHTAHAPKDILSRDIYNSYVDNITNEIEKWLSLHKEKAVFLNDCIFYVVEPKYSIHSPLSTKLWEIYPDKTIILIQNRGKEFLDLSLRRKDGKVDVVTLVRELVKDLPQANGGGHPVAAGGKIRREDLPLLKRRILERYH